MLFLAWKQKNYKDKKAPKLMKVFWKTFKWQHWYPPWCFCQNPDTLGTSLQPMPLLKANIWDDLPHKLKPRRLTHVTRLKEGKSGACSQKLDHTGVYEFWLYTGWDKFFSKEFSTIGTQRLSFSLKFQWLFGLEKEINLQPENSEWL